MSPIRCVAYSTNRIGRIYLLVVPDERIARICKYERKGRHGIPLIRGTRVCGWCRYGWSPRGARDIRSRCEYGLYGWSPRNTRTRNTATAYPYRLQSPRNTRTRNTATEYLQSTVATEYPHTEYRHGIPLQITVATEYPHILEPGQAALGAGGTRGGWH